MEWRRTDRRSDLAGVLALAVAVGIPGLAGAQSTTTPTAGPEVFVIAGGGKVIYRDQTFADIGAGAMMRFRSGFAIEGEVTRLKMSSLASLACPPFTRPPTGVCGEALHSGFRRVLYVSLGVSYFFLPEARVQPYASGGIFRASMDTVGAVGNPAAGFLESTLSEVYTGVVFGGGVRVGLTRAISLRPEFRYSYTEGFRTARMAVGVAYGWRR
jgi:hypothetical protein